MDKLIRRRELRAKRTEENLHAKFISGYIKAKYHDIYTEAYQAYWRVREKNPARKDMTKTVDFLKMTTPYTSYPVYYYSRRKETGKNKGDTPPKKTRNTYDIVLNIPLISANEIATRNDETQPPDSHEIPTRNDETQPPDSHEIAIRNDETQPPDSHEIPTRNDETQPPDSHEIATRNDETQPLVISGTVYEDLLQEINQDPDLYRIFNDMDIPDIDDMLDTPLERELNQLGFD